MASSLFFFFYKAKLPTAGRMRRRKRMVRASEAFSFGEGSQSLLQRLILSVLVVLCVVWALLCTWVVRSMMEEEARNIIVSDDA
jgi:hypothetical protein